MIVRKLGTNFALACTTYSDDDKDSLPTWRRRRIKKEHCSKSLTKLSTSSIKRADTRHLPSNTGVMIYRICTELSEYHYNLENRRTERNARALTIRDLKGTALTTYDLV